MRLPLDPPFHPAWDPVPRRHFDATLVTVETDEGVTGYGSGDTMDGFEPFEPLFTGRDPLSIAEHVRTIESIGFHAGRYWPLEAALWDIIGQVTGQPVSVLFGGASRGLPAYASFGEARSPQARADAAAAAKAAGFRAMKLRISRTDWVSSLAALRATRAAVGDEIALMADLNQWWRMPGDASPVLDATQVRRIAAELARASTTPPWPATAGPDHAPSASISRSLTWTVSPSRRSPPRTSASAPSASCQRSSAPPARTRWSW
jgi:L-alanine-DL-glutamate epimerase-like enolase superfamily enzyme